jgi:hypothetical protein
MSTPIQKKTEPMDTKAQEQKPDAAQIAAKHSLKVSANQHDYTNSWVVDAMEEYAKSENQRLTEENERLLKTNSELVNCLELGMVQFLPYMEVYHKAKLLLSTHNKSVTP